MKKVCVVNTSDFWGGGEKLQLENAIHFRNRGYDVTVVAKLGGPLWNEAKKLNFPLEHCFAKSATFLNPFKVNGLASFFKSEEIDTVIFTTSQDAKLAGFAAKKAGVKNIVYLRGLAVPIKASKTNKKLYGNTVTHLIANSEATKSQILINQHNYLAPEKVKVIYHGVETKNIFDPQNSELFKSIRKEYEGKTIIGNAGRLTKQKGQEDLIEVAKILKSKTLRFVVLIAGTGELEHELEEKIKTLGLHNEVKLLGFIDDMEGFMAAQDILALTSKWEGFGFVLVEAMLKSKPVVAYDVSSNPEIVTANETALLAELNNINEFAGHVATMITNTDLRKQFGTAGKKRAVEQFEQEKRIDELIDYIQH